MKTYRRLICGLYSLVIISVMVVAPPLICEVTNMLSQEVNNALIELANRNLLQNLLIKYRIGMWSLYAILVLVGTYVAWFSGKIAITGNNKA